MPFKSEKQKKWMYANKPEMAKRWEKKKKNEAFRPSDKKALMVIGRDTINKLRKKNPDIDKPDKQLGQAINAIFRAMTRDKDDANYKQYKKYFPKYNDKLLRRLAKAYFDQPFNVQNTFMRQVMDYTFKESVNEGFGGELKGKDKEKFEKARKENAEVLGYKLTGKSDIKESVKVRNGETPMEGKWGVYDNSTGKAIKEVGNARAATRLMNRLMSSGQYKEVAVKWIGEPVNEVDIKDIEQVLKKKQAKKIDGMYMDMTTANAIMTVYKALNQSNKKKFAKLPLKKMVDVTWKLVK